MLSTQHNNQIRETQEKYYSRLHDDPLQAYNLPERGFLIYKGGHYG